MFERNMLLKEKTFQGSTILRREDENRIGGRIRYRKDGVKEREGSL